MVILKVVCLNSLSKLIAESRHDEYSISRHRKINNADMYCGKNNIMLKYFIYLPEHYFINILVLHQLSSL